MHVGSLTQVQKIGEKCSAKTFFLPDFCLFLGGVFKLQTCVLECEEEYTHHPAAEVAYIVVVPLCKFHQPRI